MPSPARSGDVTNHGGTILGPGVPNVLICGMPASVAGDLHVCSLPPVGHQPTASIFPSGSPTVMAGGRPLVRTTDACLCGAMAILGAPTVAIS